MKVDVVILLILLTLTKATCPSDATTHDEP